LKWYLVKGLHNLVTLLTTLFINVDVMTTTSRHSKITLTFRQTESKSEMVEDIIIINVFIHSCRV